MKKNFLLSVVMLLACTVGQAQQNPFLGTWKMNLAKSTFAPGPGPATPMTTVVEDIAGGMRMTVLGRNASGGEDRTIRPAILDGKDHPITGTNARVYDTLAVTQIDARTWKEVYKKGGEVVRMGRRAVSADGKAMIFVGVGISPGGRFEHSIIHYDKQ